MRFTLSATRERTRSKSADPSVGYCFFFAGRRSGREDGLGLFTVGARPEPGRGDDGKPQVTKKQWSCFIMNFKCVDDFVQASWLEIALCLQLAALEVEVLHFRRSRGVSGLGVGYMLP